MTTVLLAVTIIGVWSAKFKKMLPVITQGDSYNFDIAESVCDNQIALSPTSVKEERIKLKKTMFVIKSPILVSNYNVYYQTLNTVSTYITLTRKY